MNNATSALLEIADVQQKSGSWYCDQLERGKILFFPGVPFELPQADRDFLLSQKQSGSRFHKNISYRPSTGILKGVSADSPEGERLGGVMRSFSREMTRFVSSFLTPYAGKLKLDFASFRPLEEQGRDLSLHKRNDLLHVDAFPTRPTHGGRILRAFVNINPSVGRVWAVGEPFDSSIPKLARSHKLAPPFRGPVTRQAARIASKIGLPVADRSRYDEFMLYLHDWLKESAAFQQDSCRQELVFPPGSTWMVYTDGVPHAVLSGQYALEQTYIVPLEALVSAEVAPLRVLEAVTGIRMAT
jgi:3-deoxy-D-manno-oct-2-ulosonic acid (Kdo) hydroxylase